MDIKNFWNERYAAEQYAYGVAANLFFQTKLSKLPVGKLLLPADGEGRNAVFAAKLGWEVVAFDISEVGKRKAEMLADRHNVKIDYRITTFEDFTAEQDRFDAIGLFYTHQASEARKGFHQNVLQWLKPTGKLILEAFDKTQLGKSSGGPKNIDWLFDEASLRSDFITLSPLSISTKTITLNEGIYHQGEASVVRLSNVM